MGDMNVKLWSRLPTEIVERTLSFLSVPALCRFRTVCKRWNSLICNSEFGALCIRHARQDACFLVARRYATYGPFDKKHEWGFLDLNARRWYTIKKDEQEVFYHFQRAPIAVAMDGGLVCQIRFTDDREEYVSVFVFNPIAKTSRRLPMSPYSCLPSRTKVNMVVDSIAHNYKIFVMQYGDAVWWPKLISADDIFMAVYESTTNQWRSLTNPPMPQTTTVCIKVQYSVIFDGMLYILMCPDARPRYAAEVHWLWSRNHVDDTWNDTGVNIHLTLAHPQFLVSDHRLFLGSWVQKPRSDTACPHNHETLALIRWSYEISEVNLEDRSCSTVFRMTGSVLAQVFDMLAELTLDKGLLRVSA